MRRNELDFILSTMLESQQEVSDLNFTVDKPPFVEAYQASVESADPEHAILILMNVMDAIHRQAVKGRVVDETRAIET